MNSEVSSITVLVTKPTAILMSGGWMEVWTPLRRVAISDVCRDVADMPIGRLMIFYIRIEIHTESRPLQDVYSPHEKVVAYTVNPSAQDIYGALSSPAFSYNQKMKNSQE